MNSFRICPTPFSELRLPFLLKMSGPSSATAILRPVQIMLKSFEEKGMIITDSRDGFTSPIY